MLEKLMQEIREGGTLETARLAQKLGTTPGMIEAMLEHLRQMGFIKAYETCGDGCSGCSLSTMCKKDVQSGQVQLWQYEEAKSRDL
jgi:hypothetical protein